MASRTSNTTITPGNMVTGVMSRDDMAMAIQYWLKNKRGLDLQLDHVSVEVPGEKIDGPPVYVDLLSNNNRIAYTGKAIRVRESAFEATIQADTSETMPVAVEVWKGPATHDLTVEGKATLSHSRRISDIALYIHGDDIRLECQRYVLKDISLHMFWNAACECMFKTILVDLWPEIMMAVNMTALPNLAVDKVMGLRTMLSELRERCRSPRITMGKVDFPPGY